MVDSSLLTILTGTGVAGVFCILFIMGIIFPRSVVQDLKEENKELKEALVAERERANAATAAMAATKDVLTAIQLGQKLGAPP